MHDEERLVLRREVMPPPSTSSGWGLIAVAATAMSFALAGSLLMVRATAAVAHDRATMPMVIDVTPHMGPVRAEMIHVRSIRPPDPACRGPVYHASGDGRAEAVFELCPPKTGHLKRIVAD